MKSNIRKRVVVFMLSMAMLLSGSISAMAVDPNVEGTNTLETAQDTGMDSEGTEEKETISFKYYGENEIDDGQAASKVNVIKYSIVLISEDGTVTYTLPQGASVPDEYTFHSPDVDMTAANFNKMSITIPGYTLDNGWAFFWWYGNYSGPMYKVPTFRNFGGISDNYPNYISYIGFQGLYGNSSGDGNNGTYEDYVNTVFGETSNGNDYSRSYTNGSGYYAYNPTGTLRVVFKKVSDKVAYKSNFVDAYALESGDDTARQIDQTAMQMTWNQKQSKYFGTLQTVTDKVPDASIHPGYEFAGWYSETDAYGNGTGTRITDASGDRTEYDRDAYYYARWEPTEPEDQDELFIKVQKTFEGIEDQEKQIPNFAVELYSDQDCLNLAATLQFSGNSSNVELIRGNDGRTFIWKIKNLDAGTYYLKERDQTVDGYTVSTVVNGQAADGETVQVVTKEAVFEAGETRQINQCNNTSMDFTGNFVASDLTDGSYFIWTEETLSAGERSAIIDFIARYASGDLKNIKKGNPVISFFSTVDKIEEGITYRGLISIRDGKLFFNGTDQWKHVFCGAYTKTEPINAEVEVLNSYTENKAEIEIQKYGSSYGGSRLKGAKFSLYQGTWKEQDGKDAGIVWADQPMDGYSNFEVDEQMKLALPSGYYRLEEVEAPEGHQRLREAICFQIEKEVVTLIGADGKPLESEPQMWKLEGERPSYVLKVKNHVLEDIPSTGGTGIYWYMIGGMLLIFAAVLILYKTNAASRERRTKNG